MKKIFLLCSLALPLATQAQPVSLTEHAAVQRALAQPALADLQTGHIEAARADALAIGQLPNPTLAYNRERTKGDGVTRETSWQLSQTFDVSGRRGLRQEASARRIDAAQAGNQTQRTAIQAEVRRRFHEVLLKQETVRATSAWAQQFTRIERMVQKLAQAGEASGYDRRRLARERQAAQARLAAEQGELDRARMRLAFMIGQGAADWQATGALLPQPLPPLDSGLAQLEQRADLRELALRAEAAQLETRAAGRGWVPDVTLGAGPKRIESSTGNHESGYVFSASIPLPIFDRQQATEKRAAAEAMQARAEQQLARARAEGDVRGLHAQATRLREAALDLRKQGDADLPRIAEAAYRGGESTLLELLDAYRGALEAELTALDLEWKAREARIEFDLMIGSTQE